VTEVSVASTVVAACCWRRIVRRTHGAAAPARERPEARAEGLIADMKEHRHGMGHPRGLIGPSGPAAADAQRHASPEAQRDVPHPEPTR